MDNKTENKTTQEENAVFYVNGKTIHDNVVEVKVASNGSKKGKEYSFNSVKGTDEDDEEQESEEKKKENTQVVPLFSLFRYADNRDIFLMITATIASMANGIAQPASFIIFGRLIERFIDYGRNAVLDIEEEMKMFAIYYVIIAACMFVCSFFQAGFWSLTATRQIHKIRITFFNSILKQDIGWFDVNESGGLTTRLSEDLTKIQSGIGDKVGMTIQALTMFFGGFGIGFYYSWKLTLIILSVTPALIITGGIMGKVMGMLTAQEQTAYAEAGAVAEEVISSIRTVVAFNGEQSEIERYNDKLYFAEKAGVKKSLTIGASMGLFHIAIFACYALAFWYGSIMVANKEINGGELLIVFFCVMIGAAQIGQVSPNFEAVTSARGAAFFVYDVCAREPVINCLSEDGEVITDVSGDIQFNNIHFNYPTRPELQVLNDFNLHIQPGTTVALVGESGCGKSTIIKLVQRFYDVDEGSIKLDGHDIKDLNVKNMRSNIGVVSQEPVLFDLSIADNIRLGAIHGATQKEIEDAAKQANAHTFISALPKGYETNVGEGGAQLSGGQKQRIAIARALIRNPKILLFDEATSALDTENEGFVQAALDKASKGRTTIIIAHRLSTVRNADVIVAVKDGQAVEMGTHSELMELKGVYHQLVLLQTMVEEEEEKIGDESLKDLTGTEREEIVKVKLLRSLSQASNGSDHEKELAQTFSRQISSHISMRHEGEKGKKEKRDKEEDKEENVDPAPFGRIMKMNLSEWPYLSVGTFFSAIVGAFPVAFAIILSELIFIFSKPADELKEESRKWALGFLGLGFIDCIGLLFSSYLFGKAGEIFTRRLRKDTFAAMLRQNISFFDEPNNHTGHLTARLATDAAAVKGATSVRLNTVIQVLVMGLTALSIAFYYSWKLTLLILAFVPFLLMAGAAHTKIFTSFASEEGKKLIEASATASQAIMNVRTVASLGKETHFIERYKEHLLAPHKKSLRNTRVFGLTFGMSSSLMMLANAAAFALGGKLVQEKELEFQNMFKVILATTFGALIAGQIASFAPDFVAAKVSAARVLKILDRIPAIDSFSTEGETLDVVDGNIKFDDVSFNYPTRPNVPVLKGLSVDIEAGQKVAFVGSSGCGKSTSIGLLERFYDPLHGSVQIDRRNVKNINLKSLRSRLGMVSQEPVLFARSIKDNIVYGLDKNVTENDVIDAAKNANIHGFISTLPKGYDTMVGEKGALISGGQKQRIAIARALIRDPKIMLLDEATSALDSESEKVVQKALDVAMEGRTSIIIAHRLSTIQNVDLIVVIQGGKIVEMGKHSELLSKKGAYYLLNQAQL